MLLLRILVLGWLFAATPAQPSIATMPMLSPPNAISQLNTIAAARGIQYKIYCTAYYVDEPEEFAVWAIPPGGAFAASVARGGKPDWYKSGFKTQEEAAKWAINAIQQPPNSRPSNDPPAEDRPKRKCAEEVHN